jgi:hypothetical protein
VILAVVGIGGMPAADALGRPELPKNPNMVSDKALSRRNRGPPLKHHPISEADYLVQHYSEA